MDKCVKVGLIGFGNMAQAMAKGWIASGHLQPNELGASAARWDSLVAKTEALGIEAFPSNRALAEAADVVVLAVKPYLVESVLAEIGDALVGKILISVAVNVHYDAMKAMVPEGVKHLSILPNTPVAVNQGILVCEDRSALTPHDWQVVTQLLSPLGRVIRVATDKMGAAGIVAGCGPAFAALFIEALADAAVKHGVARAQAYELVSQMMVGTGALQLASGAHPGAMKDAVCSPGGTTIVGVTTLEKTGFRAALIEAVDAIVNK